MQNKKLNIYISGKIGNLPDRNIPKFNAAERLIKHRMGDGAVIFNPHNLLHFHDRSWEAYMKVDVRALTRCNAVFVLDDWKQSRGAITEVLIATWLAIPVYRIENIELEPINMHVLRTSWLLIKLFIFGAQRSFNGFLKSTSNVKAK